jgi:arylformamidase
LPKYIDLSYTIEGGMTTFPKPWHPFVEISVLGRHGIEGRETRKLVLGTHSGTHCDAPRHFIPGGRTIEELPLEVFCGPAMLLDLSHKTDLSAITADDLAHLVKGKKPKRLVLRFDWSKHYRTMKYYESHPYLTEDAAQWIVENRISILGMDTPMPDSPLNGKGSQIDSPIHRILLSSEVVLLEYLCNLSEVKAEEFELLALPLKISEGDGSPVRCVARVSD